MKEYLFSVKCHMNYLIMAENEEQAREILENDGIDTDDGGYLECPSGDLDIDSNDYKEALLVDETEMENYD
tara:strand:- start:8979 stop:9191 length:213 start_codon:yes stop_codon:yes gene_type:complete